MFPDDLIAKSRSRSDATFRISGSKAVYSDYSPYLLIKHHCLPELGFTEVSANFTHFTGSNLVHKDEGLREVQSTSPILTHFTDSG